MELGQQKYLGAVAPLKPDQNFRFCLKLVQLWHRNNFYSHEIHFWVFWIASRRKIAFWWKQKFSFNQPICSNKKLVDSGVSYYPPVLLAMDASVFLPRHTISPPSPGQNLEVAVKVVRMFVVCFAQWALYVYEENKLPWFLSTKVLGEVHKNIA